MYVNFRLIAVVYCFSCFVSMAEDLLRALAF